MKAAILVLAAVFVAGTASPARAQLGGILRGANKAVETKQKIDDMTFTDEEEKQMGEQVSLQLRNRFGVYQDEGVTKYVALVGTLLAQASTRPTLDWKFIVLDTDGVNAYAAPGGIVHVTRGLLGLMKNEAELAGILGHEITHITGKHTINAIKKSKGISLGSDLTGSAGSYKTQVITKFAGMAFEKVFEGEWSRDDEDSSDKIGTQLANKVGYRPTGIADVLKKIQARNGARQERNGLFASHPAIKDRISNNEKQIKSEKLSGTATADSRYASHISFDVKPVTEVATADVAGADSLAGSEKKKAEADKTAKKDEPKKSGGFGSIASSITGNKQQASTQQASSAGARGATPDRDAVGGPNKNPLGVKISAAELEAFKKGIAS